MADLYIKELEEKVASYEAIMSRCPQCNTALPTPEAETTTTSSRQSRPTPLAQQPAAKVPLPILTGIAKESAPASTLSSSARSSKQHHAVPRTELQAKDIQQDTPAIPPTVRTNRSHRITEAPFSAPRNPAGKSSDHLNTRSVTSSAANSSGHTTTSFPPPSTRHLSHALSNADGRNRHSGKLVNLDLQQNKNLSSRNKAGRPPGESPRRADWMRTADIMLDEVPSGRHWREKITTMDSSLIAAVVMCGAPVPGDGVSRTEDVEKKELIRIVRRFAERHSEGRVNFEHLILVCLCKVLSSQGVPMDTIVETLQICISDTGKLNIERYLKGATWVNKMMHEIFFTDWGYRAVDLIVIWNRSVATYGKMAAAPNSRQHFITDLMQRKYFEGYQEVPDRRHDTIPWIVKKELGDEVSYRDICEALGYSDEYVLKTKGLHSSQPSSPNMNSSSSADGDAARGKRPSHAGKRLANRASSQQDQRSGETSPNRSPTSVSNSHEAWLLHRQLLQNDIPDESGGHNDQSAGEGVASQTTKRMVPDRSAKPLGGTDVARRRRKPYDNSSLAELPFSTSLGESAPGTQSTKRPLPDSPTSAFQPTNTTRRRQHVRERSSREEMGPPPRPGRKDSHHQGFHV